MKDVFKWSVMLVGMLFFCLACEDEKEPEPTPNPGEKAMEDVLTALEEMDEDVSEFTEALKKIGTIDLENDEVTVFAVKDESGDPKASLLSAAPVTRSISSTDVRRHVAKGRVNLASMDGNELELVSIGGDKLVVTKEGSEYRINGVELVSSTPVKAGNSYIYVVPEVIPTYDPAPEPAVSRTFKFLVQEVNSRFKDPGDPAMFPVEGATVIIAKKVDEKYVELGELETGSDGTVLWETSEEGQIYYAVGTESASSFYQGYRITGMITTYEELENEPAYETGTALDERYIGALTAMDENQDGRIDEEDVFYNEYVPADENEDGHINSAVIAPFNMPDTGTDWDNLVEKVYEQLFPNFRSFLLSSYQIDAALVNGKVDYPQLTAFKQPTTLWKTGYEYIYYFHYYQERFESDLCPTSIQQTWREEMYPEAVMQMAYIYTTLVNYFGEIPVRRDDSQVPSPRVSVWELIDYFEYLIQGVPSKEKAVIRALMARIFLTEEGQKDYVRARDLYESILNSEEFALSADLVHAKEMEAMMGPYDVSGSGKDYYYTIGYSEILLGFAETCINLGDMANAMAHINQIMLARGKPAIVAPGSSQEELREALYSVSLSEIGREDKTFMLYKRWDILMDKLGQYNALPYNRVLPLTEEMKKDISPFSQNPGYDHR